MNINPTNTNSRTRRSTLAATILGGILLAAGCGAAPRGEAMQPSFGTDGAGTVTSTVDPSLATDAPGTDPSDQPQGDNGGDDGGGQDNGNGGGWHPQGQGDDSDAGGSMEPFDDGDNDQPPAPGPCDDVLATGASMMVDPEPAVLESGTMSSALTLTNCGAEPIDWTAATIPNVTLASAGGELSGGTVVELGFTIDATAYEPGAIEFKIKVSEPGHNHYVDVHAFRDLVGSDLAGDLELTADDSIGGCAVQCITSAQITANRTSPDVTLNVGLNEPAVVDVFVDEQPPAEPGGFPVFPGASPIATSGGSTADFTTSLSPLAAATKYYIIVKATDANGNVSYRSGSFKTITPVELPDDIVDPGPPLGCFVQCITSALLSLTDDPSEMAITIDTHTSALLDVWVSTDEPQIVADVPTFGDGVDKAATTDGLDVEHWESVIAGLELDADYHVIVRARDLTGNDSYQVGTFHSAAAYLITVRFHAIHVVDDADGGGDNPGELTFRWGTEDNPFGYASVPAESGVGFLIGHEPDDVEMQIESDGGFLPTLYVSAEEFDDAEIIEACDAPLYTSFGDWEDCGISWNSASSGLITPDAFDDMPPCSDFELPDEWADEACTTISSFDDNALGFNGQPVFWAVVAFRATAV